MSESNYASDGAKSRRRLRLAHVSSQVAPRLRLGGLEPSEDMAPGTYKVSCEGASKKAVGDKIRIELKFRVIDGEHQGTALRQWIAVDVSGVISPRSRYAEHCVIALGRPLEPTDNLDNPASIFQGRCFLARVGFRMTDKPKGGKHSAENAERRKDAGDGLRVHALLSREEL